MVPGSRSQYVPDLKRVVASGRTLAYRDVGQGPPVLLLHGIGSGSASWQMQFATLSNSFRLIAWDKPGYGGSDALPHDEATNADYAHAVADLLNGLQIQAAHVLGHSLGALIAAAFARLYPARILTLTLASPATGYGNDDEDTRAAKLRARLQPLEQFSPEERAQRRAIELLTPNASSQAFEIVRSIMSQVPSDGFRQAAMMASRSDIFADAPHIGAPTFVMCGSMDRVISVNASRRVAAAIPRAIFVELPRVGHACYIEEPLRFNEALLGFLHAHV